jgi:hypothetical protein
MLLAFVAFCVAVILFVVAFTGGHLTHDPQLAGLIALAVGLALAQLPYGPRWAKRNQP